MAFEIKNYGNGSLGDVTEVTETVNSYARVTSISPTTITINPTTKIDGVATFEAGAKILIHVSASTASTYKTFLGAYLLATVTNVSGSTLTIDGDFTQILPTSEFGSYYVQAVAVAQYQNLTLSTGTTITPPVYSASSFVGGIVALMCSDTLTFDGGHISLADRGIPAASKALRPLTNNDPALDTDVYSGWENSATKDYFMLNAGDGAAFIVAKKLVCHGDSRIGNVSTFGVQFYRGSTKSVTYQETAPSKVTNVGGSTILIAAETIENFQPKMLAKYRTSTSTAGQGICRCYIASETKLRNDEGLYAYDCISTPTRIKAFNFKDFGNGNVGDVTDPTVQLNNYATITGISGRKVTYKTQTTAGLAQIQSGALVMIHFTQKNSTNVAEAGRFVLANVVGDNGTTLTLDIDVPNISTTDYAAQVVAIPQFNNFTLATVNKATPAFNGTQGGICAIAVKNNCNLSKGKLYSGSLNVTAAGAYGREGLATIGNAQDSDKLPIGQGYASIFILANKLIMDSETRIGNVYDGSYFGGTNSKGGYRGYPSTSSGGQVGSGAAAGKYSSKYIGGYGGAGTTSGKLLRGQGAHIMIVADTISGFNQKAISTGGEGNKNRHGGAGYGGSSNAWYGGYNGGGAGNASAGGSSGWAFIYCNNVINQDTTGTVVEN